MNRVANATEELYPAREVEDLPRLQLLDGAELALDGLPTRPDPCFGHEELGGIGGLDVGPDRVTARVARDGREWRRF